MVFRLAYNEVGGYLLALARGNKPVLGCILIQVVVKNKLDTARCYGFSDALPEVIRVDPVERKVSALNDRHFLLLWQFVLAL